MADLAGGARLVHEALPEDHVGRELRPEDLQRDGLTVGLADGLEHDPHRALAERTHDPVRPDALTRLQGSGHARQGIGGHAPTRDTPEERRPALGTMAR
jgi:hypothetical protein